MRSERLKYYCTYRASILERTPVGVPLATLSRRSGSCQCHAESGCRSARVLPPSFRSCSSAVASGRAVPMWARSAISGSPSIEPGSSTRFVAFAFDRRGSLELDLAGQAQQPALQHRLRLTKRRPEILVLRQHDVAVQRVEHVQRAVDAVLADVEHLTETEIELV